MPSSLAAKVLEVISNAVEAGEKVVLQSYSCASPCVDGQEPGARGGCPSREKGDMMGNITWINRVIYKAL